MKLSVFAALNQERVRYLVAGGLAVNTHGSLRFTKDMDLVVNFCLSPSKPPFARYNQDVKP